MMPTDRHKSSECRMEKGERMVENENWSLLFEFTNVADIKFKTC